MRLLIVEDDDALRSILVKRLSAEGYAVDACGNGEEGLDFAMAIPYDGIVLDIMLPGMNGFDMLRRLRGSHVQSGVLLLTAKDSIADRVHGLDLGADDYLVKPFSFDELLARIRSLLRKMNVDHSPVLSVADLKMNVPEHTVTRGERNIALTAKEFSLLEYFIRHTGQVLTRDQILDHVWNYECNFETNLVDVYVRYLRGKIDNNNEDKLIQTVRGVGYVLRAEK